MATGEGLTRAAVPEPLGQAPKSRSRRRPLGALGSSDTNGSPGSLPELLGQAHKSRSQRRLLGALGSSDANGRERRKSTRTVSLESLKSQAKTDSTTTERSVLRAFTRSTLEVGKAISDIIDNDYEEYTTQHDHLRSAASTPTTTRTSTSLPPIGRLPLLRFHMRKFLVSRIFDVMIAVIIIANSVTIGMDLTFRLEGKDSSTLATFEQIWLVIYVLESSLRMFAFGLSCFRDNWFRFDAVLVLSGVFNSWIIPATMPDHSEEGFGFIMVMRILRLSRLARTVRLIAKFQVLWMLVRGLLTSAGTMVYIFSLLSIVLYVFACLGVELISNHPLVGQDDEFSEIVKTHFDSLFGTIITLVQFVCLDSISAIYRPLISKDMTLLCYFASVILVLPIVLMNLVTAIIVNSALEQAKADKEVQHLLEEKQKARLVKKMKAIFVRLDDDASGQVTTDTMSFMDEEDVAILRNATGMRNPLDVFNLLNVDEQDYLSIDDFCDGIWKLATSEAPIEVQQMQKQVHSISKRIRIIEQNQVSTNRRLDLVLHHLTQQALFSTHAAPVPSARSMSVSSLGSAMACVSCGGAAQGHSTLTLDLVGSSRRRWSGSSAGSSGSGAGGGSADEDVSSARLEAPTDHVRSMGGVMTPHLSGIDEADSETIRSVSLRNVEDGPCLTAHLTISSPPTPLAMADLGMVKDGPSLPALLAQSSAAALSAMADIGRIEDGASLPTLLAQSSAAAPSTMSDIGWVEDGPIFSTALTQSSPAAPSTMADAGRVEDDPSFSTPLTQSSPAAPSTMADAGRAEDGPSPPTRPTGASAPASFTMAGVGRDLVIHPALSDDAGGYCLSAFPEFGRRMAVDLLVSQPPPSMPVPLLGGRASTETIVSAQVQV